MGKKNECQNINIPTTDNTSSDCTESGFFLDKCIITSKSYQYLGTMGGDTLSLLLDNLNSKIRSMNSTINRLIERIEELEDLN